jgi:hypothetical protein
MSDRFKLDVAELERPREPFRFYRAIAQNQISTSVFAQHLATLLESTPTTINVMDPGFVDTGVTREGPLWVRLPYKGIARIFGNSADEAGRAAVALLDREGPGRLNGYGFRVKKMNEAAPLQRPPAEAEEVWSLAERVLAEKGYDFRPVHTSASR